MDLKFRASYQIGANLLVFSQRRTQNGVCCANHDKWSEQLKLCRPHFDEGKNSIVILIPKFKQRHILSHIGGNRTDLAEGKLQFSRELISGGQATAIT